MLQTYLIAENLKFKHSLFRKLIVFIPVALITLSVVFIFIGIGLGGFSSSILCNWCMPFGSISIAILCHLVNNNEKKHKYRTLYSLPIDLRKTFVAKAILIMFNLLLVSLFLALITIISESISSGAFALIRFSGYYIMGYVLLWFTFLWQIPFCLFLDQKVGFIGSIIINLFASALGGLFLSLTPLFWFFPYSWPARLMVTLFGVLPNGLLIGNASRLVLTFGSCSLLVLSSILFMLVLLACFSRWYGKEVYRK